ncbi:MAG: hypothetical protein K2W95_15240 [Candidatus Obscuribacterales bacterium]|nr:hypothetical protein [Candidatus Obscuribacterales bacterium]
MARILFVVSSDAGHINQCIGPASYLQNDDHQVAFYAPKDISRRLWRAGFTQSYFCDPVAPMRLDPVRSERLSENLKDGHWSRLWLRSALLDDLQERIDRVFEVIGEFQPDVVATVSVAYEGAIAAQKAGLPWVTLTASLTPFIPELVAHEMKEQIDGWARERDAIVDDAGVKLSFRLTDVISPHANLAFTSSDLIGHKINPEFRRIGPSIPPGDRGDEPDFPWDRIRDDVPLIYMSLGYDTYNQPQVFQQVFEAVEGRDVQLICVSGLAQIAPEDVPSNVLLCEYAPQLLVLAASSMFITHGGATSVMESLFYGVPMLVSPLWKDQPHQAFFVDREKAGVRCELHHASPAVVWKHIESVLQSKKIKESVEKLQLAYKRYEGAAEAARFIAQLAEKTVV